MATLKFTKEMRYGEPYWFSGIYKISRYEWCNGGPSKPYYHAYHLNGHKSWGDYVGGRAAQYDKRLTLAECKALCQNHAETYELTPGQLKQASIARAAWINTEAA